MTLYGYTRVSTTEQAKGGSLDEQQRCVEGIALLRNTQVATVFSDAGASGIKPLEQRSSGQALLKTLEPGDVVVVSKLDRFARSASDALRHAEAFKAKEIDLIIADIGIDPVTSNGVSKLFFTILAGVAEFERTRLRERQTEGQRNKRKRGGHLGGTAPFGYRVKGKGRSAMLIEIPEQQRAIDTMRALRRDGLALRAIAAAIKDVHRLEMSHVSVGRILRDDKSNRTQAMLATRKSRGFRGPGSVPYGRSLAEDGVTLQDHPQEAAVVRRIIRERKAGSAVRAIVDSLNLDCVPARGGRWHRTTLMRILDRENTK